MLFHHCNCCSSCVYPHLYVFLYTWQQCFINFSLTSVINLFRRYKFVGTVVDKWLWFLHLFVNLFGGSIRCLYLRRLLIVNGFLSFYILCVLYIVNFYMSLFMYGYQIGISSESTSNRQAHIDKNTDFDFARKCWQGCSCVSFLLTDTQLEMLSTQMFGGELFSLFTLVLLQHIKTMSRVFTKKSHRNICMFFYFLFYYICT